MLNRRCQLLSGSPLAAFDALSEPLRSETRLQDPRAEAREPARHPAQLCNLPRMFHPSNALELSPSGLCPAQRGPHVSVSLPPVLLERELCLSPQLRRVEPSAQCEPLSTAPKRNRQRFLGPPGVLPSEALPPAVAEPTSRLFLSRASAAEADRAPQSVTACGSVSDPNRSSRRTGPYGVFHLTSLPGPVPEPKLRSKPGSGRTVVELSRRHRSEDL